MGEGKGRRRFLFLLFFSSCRQARFHLVSRNRKTDSQKRKPATKQKGTKRFDHLRRDGTIDRRSIALYYFCCSLPSFSTSHLHGLERQVQSGEALDVLAQEAL